MAIIYLCFALVILIGSIALAVYKRKETGKWIYYLTIGSFIIVFLMVLPTKWTKDGQEIWSPFLYKIVSSIFYSLKSLGGGQNLEQLETISLTGWIKDLYMILGYIIFFMAPIVTSGFILSFIGDSIDRIRYFFTFSKKCHVFSEINESTLAIAMGIYKVPGKKAIVFCNCKNVDKQLIQRAKNIHAITLYTSCSSLKFHSPRQIKEYELNLLSEHEDKNIEACEILISQKEQLKNIKLTINAFVHNITYINILESMIKEINNQFTNSIIIRFINEIGLFCNNLLYQHPLFEIQNNKKEISALIVGCGALGKEMLKTILWNGQIENLPLKISILDKNADEVKLQILTNYPKLNHYNIEFIKVDIQTPDFEKEIIQNLDATFICVATGKDELNISTAENVYQTFRRCGIMNTPPIYTRVRNKAKTNNMNQHIKYLIDRNIHIFGTIESIYPDCTLFNSELEKLALAVHLCYNDALDVDENDEKYKDALQSFYTSAYNRRSSMAVALHIPVKLYQCGIKLSSSLKNITEEELQNIEKILQEQDILDKLARNEHERWNAFMRSEGWRKSSIESMLRYAPIIKSHKDEKAYMHPCIVSWEELDLVQDAYNKLGLSKKVFKSSDYMIVSSISKIIKKAQML